MQDLKVNDELRIVVQEILKLHDTQHNLTFSLRHSRADGFAKYFFFMINYCNFSFRTSINCRKSKTANTKGQRRITQSHRQQS